MDIKNEIFSEFFDKLKNDENFPAPIVEELIELASNNQLASKENILEAINKGLENVNKD